MLIHIIGPGGSGKSTTGYFLAKELNYAFVDLDQEYLKTSIIEHDISMYGYEYYVHKNVELYRKFSLSSENIVMATSSGFMTYSKSIHSKIAKIHHAILASSNTIMLLPSFNIEECIKEIIKRQISKDHESKSEYLQRQKIIKRFPIYISMGSIKAETNKPVTQVVVDIMRKLKHNKTVFCSRPKNKLSIKCL